MTISGGGIVRSGCGRREHERDRPKSNLAARPRDAASTSAKSWVSGTSRDAKRLAQSNTDQRVADDLVEMSEWDCAILVERSPLLLKRRSIENRSTNEATNVRRSIIAGVIFKSAPIAPTVSSRHAKCEKCLIKMNAGNMDVVS
jgi:hypothetical protein